VIAGTYGKSRVFQRSIYRLSSLFPPSTRAFHLACIPLARTGRSQLLNSRLRRRKLRTSRFSRGKQMRNATRVSAADKSRSRKKRTAGLYIPDDLILSVVKMVNGFDGSRVRLSAIVVSQIARLRLVAVWKRGSVVVGLDLNGCQIVPTSFASFIFLVSSVALFAATGNSRGCKLRANDSDRINRARQIGNR